MAPSKPLWWFKATLLAGRYRGIRNENFIPRGAGGAHVRKSGAPWALVPQWGNFILGVPGRCPWACGPVGDVSMGGALELSKLPPPGTHGALEFFVWIHRAPIIRSTDKWVRFSGVEKSKKIEKTLKIIEIVI